MGLPEKEIAMAGRVLSFPKTSSLTPALEIDPFCDISRTSTAKPLPSNGGTDMVSGARAEGLGCIRGIAFALVFEAATGLAIYGVWRLIHFVG
jgi:hypothetical protein